MVNKRQLGTKAEKIALEYLIKNHFEILNTNFRCKIGEIDIIAKDKDYIVFIEVKYRKTDKNGLPRESVNYYKQKTIIKVAQWYIIGKNIHDGNYRFDVLEMLGDIDNVEINLLKNAFHL